MLIRDLENYLNEYKKLPFERLQEKYRRRAVFSFLNQKLDYNKSYLEVGCGLKPLFIDFNKNIKFDIVEPILEFAVKAEEQSKFKYTDVKVYNKYLEKFETKKKYDFIICSCLLHEVPNPKLFLEKLKSLMHKSSVLHINVPNANSLHRRLGEKMNILKNSNSKTKTQKIMQQNNPTFTIETLNEFVKKYFNVFESGGYFLKPFSHFQMQKMIDHEIINEKVLDALYVEGQFCPEIASEIYINMTIR